MRRGRRQTPHRLGEDDVAGFLAAATRRPTQKVIVPEQALKRIKSQNRIRVSRLKKDLAWFEKECLKNGLSLAEARWML